MIRILTDSASDILPAEAALLDVTRIPLNVTFEDGSVMPDGSGMTGDEFYAHMAVCKKLPMTSQPSPELYAEVFAEAKKAGDPTIVIHISSALSGTGQAARIGADMADYKDVSFVDSLSVSAGEGALVRLAVQLRDEGKTAGEIVAALERARKHLHVVAVIDDLKYLHKGGRLPAAVAIAGSMLGIKPLIEVNSEGKVDMAGKARGLPGAYVALFKKVEELGGIDPTMPVSAVYTLSKSEIDPIRQHLTQNLGLSLTCVDQVGSVIGTHAGPGAFGIIFFDALPDGE